MKAELITDGLKAAGLGALMRGVGKLTRFIPIPQPTLLVGPGSSARLGQAIAGFGHQKILIVTFASAARRGLLTPLTDALKAGGAAYVLFDEVPPDAPIPIVEKGIAFFEEQGCDAIVAFGGGSAMDAAKAIAIAATNPKPLRELAGYFKGLRAPIKIYAVPTTAGTGSEVTVAAVIADHAQQRKLVIIDPRLVPKMAALDPLLMLGLPPDITAATGMDALTHAVEAFVGRWATDYSDGMALSAVGLIFANLRTVCAHGEDIAAREKMALASSYAGLAFTRANVGYVHAIAHQFGATYHTPHGLANAMMLAHVLRFSRPAIIDRLARLGMRAGVADESDTDEIKADKFIAAIDQLRADIGIPDTLAALQAGDIPALAAAACKEAQMEYPVPRYMTQDICEDLIRMALPPVDVAPKTLRKKRVVKSPVSKAG